MRVLKNVCLCIVVTLGAAQAKNAYSVFSVGISQPMSSSAPTTPGSLLLLNAAPGEVLIPVNEKQLGMGWEAGWTFFVLPFAESESALSGLAFGGKITYDRWVRDSTLKELVILGTQVITRYYAPLKIKPFDVFVQAGFGMFIGEHGFADPDTLTPDKRPSDMVVYEGKKNLGVSFNIGIDWDIFELSPGMTMAFTEGKSSAWFLINAAMKF